MALERLIGADLRKVLEIYPIHGGGRMNVVLEGTTDLPLMSAVIATLYRPDGSIIEVTGHKDWIQVQGSEWFLLVGLEKADIPEGSSVDIRLPAIS